LNFLVPYFFSTLGLDSGCTILTHASAQEEDTISRRLSQQAMSGIQGRGRGDRAPFSRQAAKLHFLRDLLSACNRQATI
jgi:hypothetical protein